ncbi:DNA replication and repair protein RecF, partial [Candidatus Microgenomates bacterium]|nr:DNA replication and repair protein RecF [Candidatus Microgenomates bacterium]
IAFGREMGRVGGEIKQLNNERIKLDILITAGEVSGIKTPFKKFSVNGVAKRMLDFAGILKVVLFWPEDLELVTDSPSRRRKYLDFVLLQTDREYRRCLLSYEKGLRQRNRLLEAIRDEGAHRHQLIFWDQLLIKNGEYITKKREEYIDFVNNTQNSNDKIQNSNQIQNSKYQLVYDKSIISRVRLDQYKEEEVAAGVTLVGPHRDDFQFQIQNSNDKSSSKSQIQNDNIRNLSHFGSRGEQRLAILWLKLGELSYIQQVTLEKPVLLLDDILSELDHEHRKIIFEIIGNQQTIMTTTDEHFIDKSLKEFKIIEL